MSVAEAMTGMRLADARLSILLYGNEEDQRRFIHKAVVRLIALENCMQAILRAIAAAGTSLEPGAVDLGQVDAASERKRALLRILTAPTDQEGAA